MNSVKRKQEVLGPNAKEALVEDHDKRDVDLVGIVVSMRAFVSAFGSMLSGYSFRTRLRSVPRRFPLALGTSANIMMVVLPRLHRNRLGDVLNFSRIIYWTCGLVCPIGLGG